LSRAGQADTAAACPVASCSSVFAASRTCAWALPWRPSWGRWGAVSATRASCCRHCFVDKATVVTVTSPCLALSPCADAGEPCSGLATLSRTRPAKPPSSRPPRACRAAFSGRNRPAFIRRFARVTSLHLRRALSRRFLPSHRLFVLVEIPRLREQFR
jgi:hypothetical protein